jgi:type II secretory pathway pseudopilin PulG
MNTNQHESWTKPTASRRATAAFTMVEIALCLGVIAIALVAIIGVLPTGVRVQRDNREDTIINAEGMLWLEAIRSGSRGLDYLTNFVDSITVSNLNYGTAKIYTSYTRPDLKAMAGPLWAGYLTNGQTVVGFLTIPKYLDLGNLVSSNKVTARVRAITGAAAEKGPSASARDFAFAYRLISELVPLNYVRPPDSTNYSAYASVPAELVPRSNLWVIAQNEARNFYELRLTLQGPLIPKGSGYDVLGTPRTFRTLVSGARDPESSLLQPSSFVRVP